MRRLCRGALQVQRRYVVERKTVLAPELEVLKNIKGFETVSWFTEGSAAYLDAENECILEHTAEDLVYALPYRGAIPSFLRDILATKSGTSYKAKRFWRSGILIPGMQANSPTEAVVHKEDIASCYSSDGVGLFRFTDITPIVQDFAITLFDAYEEKVDEAGKLEVCELVLRLHDKLELAKVLMEEIESIPMWVRNMIKKSDSHRVDELRDEFMSRLEVICITGVAPADPRYESLQVNLLPPFTSRIVPSVFEPWQRYMQSLGTEVLTRSQFKVDDAGLPYSVESALRVVSNFKRHAVDSIMLVHGLDVGHFQLWLTRMDPRNPVIPLANVNFGEYDAETRSVIENLPLSVFDDLAFEMGNFGHDLEVTQRLPFTGLTFETKVLVRAVQTRLERLSLDAPKGEFSAEELARAEREVTVVTRLPHVLAWAPESNLWNIHKRSGTDGRMMVMSLMAKGEPGTLSQCLAAKGNTSVVKSLFWRWMEEVAVCILTREPELRTRSLSLYDECDHLLPVMKEIKFVELAKLGVFFKEKKRGHIMGIGSTGVLVSVSNSLAALGQMTFDLMRVHMKYYDRENGSYKFSEEQITTIKRQINDLENIRTSLTERMDSLQDAPEESVRLRKRSSGRSFKKKITTLTSLALKNDRLPYLYTVPAKLLELMRDSKGETVVHSRRELFVEMDLARIPCGLTQYLSVRGDNPPSEESIAFNDFLDANPEIFKQLVEQWPGMSRRTRFYSEQTRTQDGQGRFVDRLGNKYGDITQFVRFVNVFIGDVFLSKVRRHNFGMNEEAWRDLCIQMGTTDLVPRPSWPAIRWIDMYRLFEAVLLGKTPDPAEVEKFAAHYAEQTSGAESHGHVGNLPPLHQYTQGEIYGAICADIVAGARLNPSRALAVSHEAGIPITSSVLHHQRAIFRKENKELLELSFEKRIQLKPDDWICTSVIPHEHNFRRWLEKIITTINQQENRQKPLSGLFEAHLGIGATQKHVLTFVSRIVQRAGTQSVPFNVCSATLFTIHEAIREAMRTEQPFKVPVPDLVFLKPREVNEENALGNPDFSTYAKQAPRKLMRMPYVGHPLSIQSWMSVMSGAMTYRFWVLRWFDKQGVPGSVKQLGITPGSHRIVDLFSGHPILAGEVSDFYEWLHDYACSPKLKEGTLEFSLGLKERDILVMVDRMGLTADVVAGFSEGELHGVYQVMKKVLREEKVSDDELDLGQYPPFPTDDAPIIEYTRSLHEVAQMPEKGVSKRSKSVHFFYKTLNTTTGAWATYYRSIIRIPALGDTACRSILKSASAVKRVMMETSDTFGDATRSPRQCYQFLRYHFDTHYVPGTEQQLTNLVLGYEQGLSDEQILTMLKNSSLNSKDDGIDLVRVWLHRLLFTLKGSYKVNLCLHGPAYGGFVEALVDLNLVGKRPLDGDHYGYTDWEITEAQMKLEDFDGVELHRAYVACLDVLIAAGSNFEHAPHEIMEEISQPLKTFLRMPFIGRPRGKLSELVATQGLSIVRRLQILEYMGVPCAVEQLHVTGIVLLSQRARIGNLKNRGKEESQEGLEEINDEFVSFAQPDELLNDGEATEFDEASLAVSLPLFRKWVATVYATTPQLSGVATQTTTLGMYEEPIIDIFKRLRVSERSIALMPVATLLSMYKILSTKMRNLAVERYKDHMAAKRERMSVHNFSSVEVHHMQALAEVDSGDVATVMKESVTADQALLSFAIASEVQKFAPNTTTAEIDNLILQPGFASLANTQRRTSFKEETVESFMYEKLKTLISGPETEEDEEEQEEEQEEVDEEAEAEEEHEEESGSE